MRTVTLYWFYKLVYKYSPIAFAGGAKKPGFLLLLWSNVALVGILCFPYRAHCATVLRFVTWSTSRHFFPGTWNLASCAKFRRARPEIFLPATLRASRVVVRSCHPSPVFVFWLASNVFVWRYQGACDLTSLRYDGSDCRCISESLSLYLLGFYRCGASERSFLHVNDLLNARAAARRQQCLLRDLHPLVTRRTFALSLGCRPAILPGACPPTIRSGGNISET